MDTNPQFNLSIFTDVTKKVCICCFLAIVLIVVFIISPLSNFFTASIVMKIVIVVILLYVVYLNFLQVYTLKNVYSIAQSQEVTSQINMNIICNYVFTIFIILLIFFVGKSIMY